MLQLASSLHDLGIFLHFQDDPLLRRTVILKLEWGTGGGTGARRPAHAAEPVCSTDRAAPDLARAATPMADELLQAMTRFALCYQFPGEQTYVAP